MKKLILWLLIASVILVPNCVFADGGKTEENILNITVSMMPCMKVSDSVAHIELYTESGTKIGEAEEWIGGITEVLNLKFEVPTLDAGDRYILKLKEGLTYLKYYDKIYSIGEEILLEVYGYLNDEGTPCTCDSFALDAFPLFEKAMVVYTDNRQISLPTDGYFEDDTAMVPVRAVAEEMGLDVRYDDVYNSVVCSVGDREVIFNVGTSYATFFGQDVFLSHDCVMNDGMVFVPANSLAESFGSEFEMLDFGDHIDVCIGKSTVVSEYISQFPVNQWGLTSRTNYLVWVDKSDFRVRVYTGYKDNWVEKKSFPCAIGAPMSPTPTGSYEYQYRMSHWDYLDEGYYVGPCLVFYGNYALHSTLQSYRGGAFDDRVGVMISHGCVRLRKADIDWLDNNLPVGSRIYLTE